MKLTKLEFNTDLLQQVQELLNKFPDVYHFELHYVTDNHSSYYQMEFITTVQNTDCVLITVLDQQDES